MKVLTFITSISLRCGGPSRSVPVLAKGLDEAGVNITLMTQYSSDMNVSILSGSRVRLKVLEAGYSKKELREYIIREKFDLIQLQSMWDLRYHFVAKIARENHIPYIITPRGMLEPWSVSQSKWKKKLALALYQMRDMQKAAAIFTTADTEAVNVRKLGVKTPVYVIPNGIDTEKYPCRTDISKVKRQVLFLSRIHPKKGIELLIESFVNIHKQSEISKGWNLIIAGNGDPEYVEILRKKIQGLNLGRTIKIQGPAYGEDKIKLYHESALFCLPSYSENFGMVLAEAMSCGVPCITTNGTPWQMLNNETSKNGWCIDLSINNLESALLEAMSMNQEDLFEMGQKARELINGNFNYHKTAEKAKEIYGRIVLDRTTSTYEKNRNHNH